ncbi:MAG: hypothetical protein HQK62_02620 [Desulfamplus sp.]|nr:hypothetical protein [Desulfamplus sp.]MBF0257725.1 hypothetical protein [Desulfamplus sp.]
MNIQIKIEIDKELTEAIQSKFDKVAEKIIGFATLFEKLTVQTEDTKQESKSAQNQGEKQAKDIAQNETKSFSEDVLDKSIEPEKTKKIKVQKKQKSKAAQKITGLKSKKTALAIVFNTIEKSDGGINVEDLKKMTGFEARKVADAVYRLKKSGKIDKTSDNLYIAL